MTMKFYVIKAQVFKTYELGHGELFKDMRVVKANDHNKAKQEYFDYWNGKAADGIKYVPAEVEIHETLRYKD